MNNFKITNESIVKYLELCLQDAVSLTDCVLNIRAGRSMIYYPNENENELEIIYADNHKKVSENIIVNSERELEQAITDSVVTANVRK